MLEDMAAVDVINKTQSEGGDVSLRDFTDARADAIRLSMGLVSIRDYIDLRITNVKELLAIHNTTQKDSITTARDSMDKRLEGMNEFRQQMSDMSSKFASRDETNSTIKYLSDRVSTLETGLVTRAEHSSYWASQATQVSTMQSRLTAIEAAKAGATEVTTEKRADNTLLIAAIGVATAIMVAVVAWNHTTPPIAPISYTAPVPTVQVAPK